ncbi:periplasmic binding protein [Devosia pacifica]|uniref:Periplasmic binding protein n=1 Tax=Devosia pacifica TaxID=1335967 RepID=A0A918VWV7_9HYPH|nr:iron-siderophore ABC transporter substrate-binding protein [Devosia pacifica]GHA36862.1 periplasmic binding protein [Devosia pacifica]
MTTINMKTPLVALLLGATSLSGAALAQDSFPKEVESALGTAEISEQPERVVTWGWSTQDVVIDLGIVPVGMPFFAYGGGEDGVLPWTEQAIADLGAEMPTILPNSGEPPIEAIAALEPDVIIAPYSGITEEEYAALSQIAPVVAYPESAWFATWQQVVEMTGKALGLTEEADELIAETEAFMQQQAAQYPALQEVTFVNFIDRDDGQVSVRTAEDPRTRLLVDLGMEPIEQAPSASSFGSTYAYGLSYENFDELDADVLVSFFDNPEDAEAFFARPYIQLAPQVQSNALARLEGEEITMAVSGAITPMSLRYGFPQYIEAVGEAAQRAVE